MRIAYYTAGVTGWGHLVQGLAIGNALVRNRIKAEYRMLTGGTVPPFLATNAACIKLPPEGEGELSGAAYKTSALYTTLVSYAPDILLVDLDWFMVHAFVADLGCRKIFLCREVAREFFTVPLSGGDIEFRPGDYDLVLATEPFDKPFPMEEIHPVVLRNPGEILSRREACRRLGIDPEERICFFAFKESPREDLAARKTYAYLGEEGGYRIIYTADYENGLFPVVDFFNACDFLITGAGYNSFWEARYFRKEAIHIPMPRHFEKQYRRVEELSDHTFDENGADQLVHRMFETRGDKIG